MTQEEKAKAYEMALEAARKELGVDRKEWEVVERVLKSIFPELRESESEDERIRKDLIAVFETIEGTWCGISVKGILSYLNKQKEQKPVDEAENFFDSAESYHQGFIAGQKKMKEDIEKGFGIGEHSLDYLAGRYAGYTAAKQEQKPELVQQPPITYTYNSNASRDERLKAALLALLNSDLLKVKEGGYFTKQDLIEWVERIPTDKPAEWSDEDTEMYINVASSLRGYACGLENEEHKRHIKKGLDWLEKRFQSLRPDSYKKCNSRWKPSEEQLEALNKARRFIPYNCDILESLYEQLKQL